MSTSRSASSDAVNVPRLPREILDRILGLAALDAPNVDDDERRLPEYSRHVAWLASLRLVSRHFETIARPHLFRNLVVLDAWRLEPLAKLFRKRPKRARLVKHAVLDNTQARSNDWNEHLPDPPFRDYIEANLDRRRARVAAVLKRILPSVRTLRLGIYESLLPCLTSGSHIHAPHLNSLNLAAESLHRAQGGCLHAPRLRRIVFDLEEGRGYHSFQDGLGRTLDRIDPNCRLEEVTFVFMSGRLSVCTNPGSPAQHALWKDLARQPKQQTYAPQRQRQASARPGSANTPVTQADIVAFLLNLLTASAGDEGRALVSAALKANAWDPQERVSNGADEGSDNEDAEAQRQWAAIRNVFGRIEDWLREHDHNRDMQPSVSFDAHGMSHQRPRKMPAERGLISITADELVARFGHIPASYT
ncbi:uncharacterized protein PFL1_01237 [Pseudozyma flocculosa PF-1]|uniref:uncharacterized protein n=1 Tax=Pseudozyma flocculosa PF-1 TaxID=1277687 RepID=UPI0004560469|nr:uncharacterized protein PFL1_01237 [Pseudozyma flocculosa PF-1]EPQ31048.1 hypothetical protein PFL1_01237 [Pseudozyma flocculosa PF-1]